MIVAVCLKIPFNFWELIRSVFPFMGRAYWYVTDYILLILLAPTLNVAIKSASDKYLKHMTVMLFIVFSIFQTFLPFLDWTQDYSNIGLFILLYFITACVKRNIGKLTQISGGILWGVSFAGLVGTWMSLHILSVHGLTVLSSKEMWFYQYSSPFVILEAVGLFEIFMKCGMSNLNLKEKKVIIVVSNASLVTYLIHMHPIFKNKYIEWGLFSWVNTESAVIYLCEVIGITALVMMCGVIISLPIVKVTKRIICDKMIKE